MQMIHGAENRSKCVKTFWFVMVPCLAVGALMIFPMYYQDYLPRVHQREIWIPTTCVVDSVTNQSALCTNVYGYGDTAQDVPRGGDCSCAAPSQCPISCWAMNPFYLGSCCAFQICRLHSSDDSDNGLWMCSVTMWGFCYQIQVQVSPVQSAGVIRSSSDSHTFVCNLPQFGPPTPGLQPNECAQNIFHQYAVNTTGACWYNTETHQLRWNAWSDQNFHPSLTASYVVFVLAVVIMCIGSIKWCMSVFDDYRKYSCVCVDATASEGTPLHPNASAPLRYVPTDN